MKAVFSDSQYNRITASMATNTSSEIVRFEGEHCGVCEQRAPICESSSIMMRDSPHSSKLLMSLFLVEGLPQCLVYMWD